MSESVYGVDSEGGLYRIVPVTYGQPEEVAAGWAQVFPSTIYFIGSSDLLPVPWVTTRDRILSVLRSHWPESGGQSSHLQAVRAQEAAADALLALLGEESP